MDARKRIIVVMFLAYIIGIAMGFIWGSYESLKIYANIASNFINISSETIEEAVRGYDKAANICNILN